MRLEFDEVTDLSPDQVYDHFRTPHNWPSLFAAFGETTTRTDGWIRVPIRHSPFSLIAKIDSLEPGRTISWDLAGLWKGRGEISLEDIPDGTRITGYEEVCLPRLLGWGGLVERWAQPRFVAIWESGWRRIRRQVGQ